MTTSPAFRELPRMLLAILFIVLGITLSLWILRPFLSALVWAALFVSLGYFFGAGAEQVSGGAFSHGERLALGAGLVVAVAALGLWFGLRLRNRRR